MKKDTFKFKKYVPYMDWFKEVEVIVNKEDYSWFELERRFDNTWYLIGVNRELKSWEKIRTDLGLLGRDNRNNQVKEFIEWAGNSLIGILSIGGGISLIKAISEILKGE